MKSTLLLGISVLTIAQPAFAQAGTPPTGQSGAVPAGEPQNPQLSQTGGPPSSPQEGIQDIVVTAQRRSESLQKVPIAVSVATAAQLQASGVSGIDTIKLVAPGVDIQSNSGYVLPIIRGVGSKGFGAGIESPIAVYVDGVYYAAASSSLLSFNNISQIEVLKGPQGTLFGRNATGGLIQVQTRDPKHDLGGEVNLSYGNYQTVKGDAYITGGLTDNLAVDLAVVGTTMGNGWGKNLFNGKDIYKIDHDIGVRSKLLFTPGDRTEARLTLDYSNVKNNMFVTRMPIGGTAPPPYGPSYGGGHWDTDLDQQPYLKDQSGGAALRIDHDLDIFKVASITAYRESSHKILFDLDYTPTRGRVADIKQTDWQFSQELQLLSPSTGRFTWVLGAYYFRADSKYPYVNVSFLGPASIPTPAGNVVLATTRSRQETDSISGFGQAAYKLTDSLRATVGLRYTSEKRTLADAESFNTTDTGGVLVTIPLNTRSIRFNKLTWRFALDYQLTPDTLIYASYNRGFKSGGFNPSALTIGAFQPEVLDAYEGGLKTTLFDRRIRFNAAGYYYDYKNVQIQRAVSGATGIYNGAEAHIYGGEADIQAQVTSEFNVTIGYQYTHGRYTSFPNALVATPNPAGGYFLNVGDVSGNTTVLSPKSTLNLGANYTVPLSSGKLTLNGTYYYNSGFYQEPDNRIRQKAYAQVNASVRYKSDAGWSVSVWGANLTDRAVANLDGVQSLGAEGVGRVSYAAPRTYGVTVGATF